ncbi:hypothetical protein ID866_8676 [Astraeus odoratus]|nr:hypothetical protein ID866_8676 [Astraeus odoratus]
MVLDEVNLEVAHMVQNMVEDQPIYQDQVLAIFPDKDWVVNLIMLGRESFAVVVVVLPERPAV